MTSSLGSSVASPETLPETLPKTMRALTLRGVGMDKLALEHVAVPQPSAGQLLARVDAAGVCTSLLKLIAQGREHPYLYGWDLQQHPLILGDEGAVTLVAVGKDLQDQYHVGERYVVQPAVDHAPINHRERYANGARGVHKVAVSYTLPGHLAEYMLIGEEILAAGCLLPMPAGIASAHAALAEPLSCAVSAQAHHLRVTQKDSHAPRTAANGLAAGGVTVIIGAGAMGRMHVDIALAAQPRAIIIADVMPERLQLCDRLFAERAAQHGIKFYTTLSGDALKSTVLAVSERGADDVIVAVGVKQAIHEAQFLLARGGVLNLFGGLPRRDAEVAFDTTAVHYNEIVITGSSGGSPWDVAESLSLMAKASINPSVHITRIADLTHVPRLLEQMKNQQLDGKAMIYPHRPSQTIRQVSQWTQDDERDYLAAR